MAAATHGTRYGSGHHVALPYATAIEHMKDALRAEGFGILAEIDVQKTMKEKRGFRPYVILGACNPQLAERALAVDLGIGLLLPCNVVVYEADGGSVVEVQDPATMFQLAQNSALQEIADEVTQRLRRALGRVDHG